MSHSYTDSQKHVHMRIIFAAGPEQERGGPAAYVRELARELRERSYQVGIVHYRLFRSSAPGLRHLAFTARLLARAWRAQVIIAVDTWSTGIPALVVAKITGTRLILRVGGDFLWEQYTERTGATIRLSEFYTSHEVHFSFKERLIFRGTRFLLKHADYVAFNTEWQKSFWDTAYGLTTSRTGVIENRYPHQQQTTTTRSKVFVSAGRMIKMKNNASLIKVFSQAQKSHPEFTLDTRILPEAEHAERLRTCHAVIQASISDISPNTVIEASSYGTPFICTADTGIMRRLSGKGLFVDTPDEDVILKAITELMDPEVYARIHAEAQTPGYEREWSAVADDFESVLTTNATSS